MERVQLREKMPDELTATDTGLLPEPEYFCSLWWLGRRATVGRPTRLAAI